MSANSGILKDKNNQDFYPHSYAELIHTQDGSNVEAKLRNLFNLFYPIGSIYMSATLATAEEVDELFGGTWVAWGSGKVPVGVDTNDTDFNTTEKTGGEKSHQLTIDELPTHNHGAKTLTGTLEALVWGNQQVSGILSASGRNLNDRTASTGSNFGSSGFTVNASHTHDSVGLDEAHNNLQPYITCYMYKRIA